MFDAFLAPRPAPDVPMPTIRRSFARGLVTVLSTPFLVIGTLVLVIAEWLAVVAAGFQGPFAVFVHALALPPVGTLLDVNVSGNLFPGTVAGLLSLGAAIVLRGAILAIVAAASVQAIRDGRVTRWVWVPAIRAFPASLAVSLASLSLLFVQAMLGAFIGGVGGLGQLLLIGGLVLGVSYFGFAPAIAASEDRRLIDTLTRAYRTARIPGSGNLTLAVLYVVPSFAVLLGATAMPGGQIGVNPSVGAWVLVLLLNILHVAVGGTYAFRYLAISEWVPETAPRSEPRRR
jgi:hypothetical protein